MPELYPTPVAPYPTNDESMDARTMPGHYLAYGRHNTWCAIDDTPGVPVDDDLHPVRCESLSIRLPDAYDDAGGQYAGSLLLAGSYTHGFYPAPSPRAATFVRVELWGPADHEDGEANTTVNITPDGARSLAAKLVALADKADGIDML